MENNANFVSIEKLVLIEKGNLVESQNCTRSCKFCGNQVAIEPLSQWIGTGRRNKG